jgi:drug/metabolite transporter superfamily protein YnfA
VIGLGAVMLVAYGLVVNFNRTVDFGRLMGLYITIFFLVSQVLSALVSGERPSVSLIVGGGFIVVGVLIIQAGL